MEHDTGKEEAFLIPLWCGCLSVHCLFFASLLQPAGAVKTPSPRLKTLHPKWNTSMPIIGYSWQALLLNMSSIKTPHWGNLLDFSWFPDSGGMVVASAWWVAPPSSNIGNKNKIKKESNKFPACRQKRDDWKMLESGVRAFGWINPLLGQMASSPCRAHKPQFVTLPAFVCVCVCTSVSSQKKEGKKKEKSSGSQAVAKMVDGSVLVLEYDWSLLTLPLCMCVFVWVCMCIQSSVSWTSSMKTCLSFLLENMEWLASLTWEHVCWGELDKCFCNTLCVTVGSFNVARFSRQGHLP